MNSFWIELDGFFCQTKINFTELIPLQISKIKINKDQFVTIVDSWNLLTSVASSLDPPLLNYDFQRTEESCSDVASLVVFVDGGGPLFVFILNPKRNHNSDETILETLSMSGKALKMLLNNFSNVSAVVRLACRQF